MTASADPAATVEVDIGFDIATITQTGRLRSIPEAIEIQSSVEAALVGSAVRYGLFDNRATLPPAPEIRQTMWHWLQSGRLFDRVALVLESAAHGRKLNLAALSHSVPVRAFSDAELARNWLVTAETWLRRNLLVYEDGNMAYAVPAESVSAIRGWTEPIPIPGVRDETDSLIGDAILGMVEHGGSMVAVRRPRRVRVDGSDESPTRLILFEPDWGGFALPAARAHVVGRVQLARSPQHDRDVDSAIGLLRYLDPRKLAGGTP